MSISKIDPTITIEKLTNTTEGQFFDRKSARLATKDFAHHLSAFANASGGIVAIGIEDNGKITGVKSEEENSFRQAAFDFMQIPLNIKLKLFPYLQKTIYIKTLCYFT